jgi:hypothetical protein
MTTNTTTDLFEDTIATLAEAAFLPADYVNDADELELTERDRSILAYYEAKGIDAFRIEAVDASAWALLVRWSEDGYELTAIDRNGVILCEARFNFTPMGLAWLAGALNAADEAQR